MSWKTLHAAIDWLLNAAMWSLGWWLVLVVIAVWWTQ
jgi:hypothetical protein